MFNEVSNPDVKERILSVARTFFIKEGYNKTSIRDIAAASGTNVAMVNYYYHSKYNLFEIIFEEALSVLLKRIFSTIYSEEPFLDVVKKWIDSYYETLQEYPQIPVFILNEINQNPERLSERIRSKGPEDIFQRISERIEQEVKAGTIRDIPPLDFALNILSLCVFPFIFGRLATNVANRSMEEYEEVLIQHKEYVKEFVINAIKL